MLQLIFLVVFPFAVWKAWKNIQMAKASTGWPTVKGTITKSETAKVMFRRQPRVSYAYSVNGAPFAGNRISFAAGYRPKETDAILSRYPVGREVVVAHAPDNPVQATLETGSNRQVTAEMRLLLICFVVIILSNVLYYYVKRQNQERRPPIRTYGAVQIVDPVGRPGLTGQFDPEIGPSIVSPPCISDPALAYEVPRIPFGSQPGFRCS